MTLLWMDGFDGKDTSLVYETVNVFAYTWFPQTQYASGWGFHCGGSSGRYIQKTVTGSATIVFGIRTRWPTATAVEMFHIWSDDTIQHLTFMSTTNSAIEVRRGTSAGTVLATSANNTITSNFGWVYIEVKATIADSGGIVQVRINGNTTPVINFSGDTKNAGTSTNVGAIRFFTHSASYGLDDMYILNGLTGTNNDFLSPVVVPAAAAESAGTYTQMTPSTGSNWDCTNDYAATATTDYVSSATVGNRDTYTMQGFGTNFGSTIYAAQLCSMTGKSGTDVRSMKTAMKIGSSLYYGGTRVLPAGTDTYTLLREIQETSPATSAAWTSAELEAIEFGAEVAA